MLTQKKVTAGTAHRYFRLLYTQVTISIYTRKSCSLYLFHVYIDLVTHVKYCFLYLFLVYIDIVTPVKPYICVLFLFLCKRPYAFL